MIQQNKTKKPQPKHIINNAIPFNKVFVVGENGEKLGVKTKEEALDLALEARKDLVLISTTPKPIARILDYGKFKYDSKKKEKELKEKQTNIQNREVRLTPFIGENDLIVKSKKAREFLLKGDRIKVSLKLRGREIGRKDLGITTLNKFYETLEDVADIAKEAKVVNDRFLDMNLQPNKTKIAKYLKDLEEKNKGEN